MHFSSIFTVVGAAFVLGAGLVAPTYAQDEQFNIKPLQVAPDINNVDLLSGKYRPVLPELSIPAAPRLTFNTLQQFDSKAVGILRSPGTGGEASFSYSVTFGLDISEHFTCQTSTDCTPASNTGSTFRASVRESGGIAPRYVQGTSGIRVVYGSRSSYILDRDDGTEFSTGPGTQVTYYATLIEYPDGEQLVLEYDTAEADPHLLHRPARVISNTGYEMRFTYQSDDVNSGALGWSRLQRAAIVKSSAPSVELAAMDYGQSGSATDLAGRQWLWSGFSNALGSSENARNFTFRGPADTQDQIEVTSVTTNYAGVTHNNFVTQVQQAGQTYQYAYTAAAGSGYSPRSQFTDLVITGPQGYRRTLAYDVVGAPNQHQLIRSDTDALGQRTEYTYTGNRVASVTFPEGNKVFFSYDDNGNITQKRTQAKPGSSLTDKIERAVYPSPASCTGLLCYRPLYTIDANGQRTDYTFSAEHGGLLTRTEPADAQGRRRVTTHTYSLIQGMYRRTRTEVCADTGCTANAVAITDYTYWGATGLVASETRRNLAGTEQLTTTYTYDAAGRVLQVDGPLSGSDDATSYRYDAAGRVLWEVGPRNAAGYYPATRTTYPTRSARQKVVAQGTVSARGSSSLMLTQQTSEILDAFNRVTVLKTAGTGAPLMLEQRSFDSRGRVLCKATRMNPAAFGALPSSACTLGSEGSAGPDRITRYLYDKNSNVLSTITGVDTPAEGIEQYTTYTANGQVARHEDGNNNNTLYHYDGFDRLVRTDFANGSYESYTYDANDNRTSKRLRNGQSFTYYYDALNQRIRTDVPYESATLVTYDVLGRELQISRGSEVVAYTYDGLGRRISERTQQRTLTYRYDAGGRRTRTTFPDGFFIEASHDSGGRLTALRENGTTEVLRYSYERNGRVQRAERAGSTVTTMAYDELGRFTQLNHQGFNNSSYSYNAASQLSSKSVSNSDYQIQVPTLATEFYKVNVMNQYTEVASDSAFDILSYTQVGNLANFDGWNYVYDAHNRLIEANGPSTTVVLSYDAIGRLTRTVHNGQVIDYLYDGNELVAEYNSAGSLLRRYVHGLGDDDPVIRYEGAGTSARRYLLADERGSIIAEMTHTGSLLQAHQYDAYGNPKHSSSARFRYTGQILIPGTELYYYKARVYHPKLGRFMQTDPIGYQDGMNWYAYVGNDPVNMADPDGRIRRPLFRFLKNPWWSVKRGYRNFKRFLSDNGVIAPTPTPVANSDAKYPEVPEVSPEINPEEIAGSSPDEIDETARRKGLKAKGPDPKKGRGAYVDPVTGKQRILVHPDADCGPHCHVNDAEGRRLGPNGDVVNPESLEAHLPLGNG